jgi:hypothetical protein
LYRPSTVNFYPKQSERFCYGDTFGGAGDRGLLCKWHSNLISGGDNLPLFRNGIWFSVWLAMARRRLPWVMEIRSTSRCVAAMEMLDRATWTLPRAMVRGLLT